MKFVLSLALVLCSSSAFAFSPLTCGAVAQAAAARYHGIPLKKYQSQTAVIWSCKYKADPSQEEIQFSDGRWMTGVSLSVIDGQCVVKEIYDGQDDQDPYHESDSCL